MIHNEIYDNKTLSYKILNLQNPVIIYDDNNDYLQSNRKLYIVEYQIIVNDIWQVISIAIPTTFIELLEIMTNELNFNNTGASPLQVYSICVSIFNAWKVDPQKLVSNRMHEIDEQMQKLVAKKQMEEEILQEEQLKQLKNSKKFNLKQRLNDKKN